MLSKIKSIISKLSIYKVYINIREYNYIKKVVLDSKVECNNSNHKGNIYVLLEPEHDNIGDQGIAWAQQKFVCDNFKSYNKYFITENNFNCYSKHIKKIIKDEDIIFIHGGGNLGNQYMHHENSRRNLIQLFPNNKIICFPQTIYFTNDEEGKKELDKSIEIYSKHRNLTFIAREETSFKNMKKYFRSNKVILTPDIVLYVNNMEPKIEREGILVCLRNDEETILNKKTKDYIIDVAKYFSNNVKVTDMRAGRVVPRDYRMDILNKKFNEFKSSELVITDRLHGMIFAAITGTPCIAASNYNHKVRETYNWIKNLNYVKFVDNFDNLEQDIQDFNNIKEGNYDNKSIIDYYKQIVDLV